MCGIFGVILGKDCELSAEEARSAVRELFRLSESRGKEASGLALARDGAIQVLKRPVTASSLMRTREFAHLMAELDPRGADGGDGGPVALIGHSRLVTDGAQSEHDNNQPVHAGRMVGIHNGIVVNAGDLWRSNADLRRRSEVDSEVIFSLLRREYGASGSLTRAVDATYGALEGTAAIAALFEDADDLLLATNNGSLYVVTTGGERGTPALLFASEHVFLAELARKAALRPFLKDREIVKVEPGSGHLVALAAPALRPFAIGNGADPALALTPAASARAVVDLDGSADGAGRNGASPLGWAPGAFERIRRRYPFDEYPLTDLRRCTRCILPATVPSIRFDDAGVCNFCRSYRKLEFRGEDALRALVEPHRSRNGEPDCIVGLSGGRDSTYGLHYVKTVLGMNPVAYTYDWGMVTDLARRNIARICGKLGVEHLLVSADINKKRRYIRENVTAWLRQPELGMIPLFMAGDKQYFHHAFRLRKQLGVELLFLCENMLERDYFKAGFAGAPAEATDDDHIGHLSWLGNLRILAYYARNYLTNSGYLNASLLDTAWAYLCYFVIERDYENLFRYVPWEEEEVVGTLIDEYDWERATDTKTTWRIGDGTASFYNFIYYQVAGFSENDNFYSNQIREGTITRARALEIVADVNRPRFESIKWYCDTIGIDFEHALDVITRIPKLYRQ